VARPSGKTDEKLLQAGRELIQEQGLSALGLRAVAKRAGVNLGMFHYHFRNKAEFSQRCTGEVYSEFYKGFELVTADGDTVERLHKGLLALGRFSREQRHFLIAMLRDLEAKNPEAWSFMRSKFPPPHSKVMMELIQRGQKEGVLLDVPLKFAMSSLMSAISFPNLIAGLAEGVLGTKMLNIPKQAIEDHFLSDEALEARVELAMRMLLVDPPKKIKIRRTE
jgi:AcrR family transcriptional regulator